MDWTTIRVLSNNLGQLLDQMERNDHIGTATEADADDPLSPQGTEYIKDSWSTTLRSVTVSLSKELNLGNDFENVHPSNLHFSWISELPRNLYVRTAKVLFPLAQKLIADYDAQVKADAGKKISAD